MYMLNNSECKQAQYDLFFSLMELIGKITKLVIKYGVNSILLITWYVAAVSSGRCVWGGAHSVEIVSMNVNGCLFGLSF